MHGIQQATKELEGALGVLPVDGPSNWQEIVDNLSVVIRAPIAGVYNFVCEGSRLAPGLAHISQVSHAAAHAHIDSMITGGTPISYDPVNVARASQNRVETLTEICAAGRASQQAFRVIRHVGERLKGLSATEQVRVLLTEGNTLLGWVGGMSDDPAAFGRLEKARLRKLVPAFRRRLLLENRVGHAPLRLATLDALLEGMTQPVFVTSNAGVPLIMNFGARALWEQSRQSVQAELSDALRGDRRLFNVSPVRGNGLPTHWLLVRHATAGESGARRAKSTRDWGLTQREGEVLALVAEGTTNAAIARELGCAERTVELHVTRLLQKSSVNNRASLVAAFWTGG